MSVIRFTGNVTDHSTQNGFQFEFHCDKCGNGVTSAFIPSRIEMAGGFLKAVSSFFGGGGVLGNAAHATDYLRDQARGRGRDQALAQAVEAARPHFCQCGRCGKWVCPEHCWNHKKGLCEACAPDLEEELAAAQAAVAAEQVWEKARATNLIGDLDVAADKAAACPHCHGKPGNGKFCQECGQPLRAAKPRHCGDCGAKVESNSKFCTECGSKAA